MSSYKYSSKPYYGKRKASDPVSLTKSIHRINRMLDVEFKHIDYKFGTSDQNTLLPVINAPVIRAIPLPESGTDFDQRIGNQIKIVGMSTRLTFNFKNNEDKYSRNNCRVRIFFSKDASSAVTPSDLLATDGDGHYSVTSFDNSQRRTRYHYIHDLECEKSHQFMHHLSAGNELFTSGTTAVYSIAKYIERKDASMSIPVSFKNNINADEQILQNKPYIFAQSDIVNGTITSDSISIHGVVRIFYVDN